MGHRNRFKYRCADCGWTGFFNKYEFARRCRPHCGACGCTLLDPTHDAARQRILSYAAEAKEDRERKEQAHQFGNPSQE